jgi:hypothetical protein
MNRVLLINRTKAPSREELSSSERRTGELLFAEFPELSWAGYMIAYNNVKAANWIIPADKMTAFCDFVKTLDSEGYEVAVYTDGQGRFGGQCEVRVI